MYEPPKFNKGDRVFRLGSPSREGIITGDTEIVGGIMRYPVSFEDGTDLIPASELEEIVDGEFDLIAELERRNFGNTADLRRNLSHVLISGKLASVIYSMDVTNTDFLPHQFKPVLTFLESPAHGLLIADEVGLGKTIEAGLIWTELRARYDSRRILVVCPAMLREKWRDELRNRFGVDASIMDTGELLHELKTPRNEVLDGKGIICSIQGISPPRDSQRTAQRAKKRVQLEDFLEDEADNPPLIDLVVIDEAHYMRNSTSSYAKLGRLLRDVSEHILLLSATPINLRETDLFNLLHLADPDTFQQSEFFTKVLKDNAPLVEARRLIADQHITARQVQNCLKRSKLDSAALQDLIETLNDPDGFDLPENRIRIANKIDKVNLLRHVVNRTRKKEVSVQQVVRKPKRYSVNMDGNEREFYEQVGEAIRSYATENGISDGFLLVSPQQQVSSCLYAAATSWKNRLDQANPTLDEDLQDDAPEADNDLSPLISYLAKNVLPTVNLQQLRKTDSKFTEFYRVVNRYLRRQPDEKIIVFSYFRATLHYLNERLAERGIDCQVLTGGMSESKQEVINRFRDTDSIRVLLSSEVASEGVDLQFCRALVNYDLPWNPMRIEQRIGRIDRIGQEAESISILNLGHANTIDERIYERLFKRLEIFEYSLGGMEAILGEEIKGLTLDLLSQNLTSEEEENRIEQTALAIENKRQMEQKFEEAASQFMALGDYILNKVNLAHELKKRITEDDLVIYVRDYLNRHATGHEFRQTHKGGHRFSIRLPVKMAAELDEFIRSQNLRRQTTLVSGTRVECEFINKTAGTIPGIEAINQFHPLISFISNEIKEQGFFQLTASRISPTVIGESGLDKLKLPTGQYAFAIQKWSFRGLREVEDIHVGAMHLEQNFSLSSEDSWRLLNAARLHGVDWPEAVSEAGRMLKDKIFECNDYLDAEYKKACQDHRVENTDRVNLQKKSAEQHYLRLLGSRKRALETLLSRDDAKSRKIIPATEGRIKKIESNFEVQIKRLEDKAKMQSYTKQISFGVLLIG